MPLYRLLTSLVITLALSHSAFAETSVWKVSKAERVVYLGGTLHILADSDYPLPAEFESSYAKADKLIFETDLAAVQSPEFQRQLIQKMTYLDGTTIKDHLKAETYTKLARYCQQKSIPLAQLGLLKPSLLTITLTVNELQNLGLTQAGVDAHFDQRAKRENKPVGTLESIDQQLEFLANMGAGKEDELVLQTLDDLENLSVTMSEMKLAWRSGNAKKLEVLAITPMKNNFPEVYQSLLVTRNANWMAQIETMIKTPEVELILVGALHLAGPDGLIKQLRNKGYKVEQL